MVRNKERVLWNQSSAKPFKQLLQAHRDANWKAILNHIYSRVNNISYEYSSLKAQMNATLLFIQTWQKLLSIASRLPFEDRKQSYLIILAFMNRNEFDPFMLEKCDPPQRRNTIGGFFTGHKNNGLLLKQLIYETMRYVIRKMQSIITCSGDLYFLYTRIFVCCLFRIANKEQFNYVVDWIINDASPVHESISAVINEQLRNTDYYKIDNITQRLLRYHDYFNKFDTVKYQKKVRKQITNISKWLPDHRNKNFFWNFLTEFTYQVHYLLSSFLHLPWRDIPGYESMLRILFSRFDTKYISTQKQIYIPTENTNNNNNIEKTLDNDNNNNYNDDNNQIDKQQFCCFADVISIQDDQEWVEVVIAQSYNPAILNILIHLLFYRTRLFVLYEVGATFDIIEKCVLRMRDYDVKLPENVNLDTLETGLILLLDSEHYYNMVRACVFMYNFLDILQGKSRIDFISEFIFKRYFFSLFLHWNDDVRGCFYRILLYKLKFQSKQYQDDPSFSEKIKDTQKHKVTTMRHSFDSHRPSKISSAKESERKTNNALSSIDSFSKISPRSRRSISSSLVSESTLFSDQAMNTVLESKLEMYLDAIYLCLEDKQKVNQTESFNVPYHLRPYVIRSIEEWKETKKEFELWKRNWEQKDSNTIVSYPVICPPTISDLDVGSIDNM